jgi:hypothetical protein
MATFTTDLCEAVTAEYRDTKCISLATGSVRAMLEWLDQQLKTPAIKA